MYIKLVVLGELQKQKPAVKIYKHIKDKRALKESQHGRRHKVTMERVPEWNNTD